MDVSHPPNFNNPSTSYLSEDIDYKKPYVDEDLEYQYPPGQRAPLYPPVKVPKTPYSDVAEDEGEFSESRQALNPLPPPEKDRRSWVQRYLPSSTACRLYLLVILLQTAFDLTIEADILIQFDNINWDAQAGPKPGNVQSLPIYLGIFALAHVFQFILAIDAVVFRNTLQFVFLAIFNALMLAYSAIQISEISAIFPPDQKGIFSKVPITILTDIIPIVTGVAEIAYIGLGWKIYTEFGWQLYKLLGADRRIKKMYAQYQIFESMLKFDVFFWLGFSIQFIGLVLNHANVEFALSLAALPLSMLLLVQGHLAAKRESKWMMISFFAGLVAGLAYFSYKLVTIFIRRKQPEFRLVYKSLTTFTAISLVLLITTFIWGIMVMRNFGRGLKEQLSKSKGHQDALRNPRRAGALSNSGPNRMTIE